MFYLCTSPNLILSIPNYFHKSNEKQILTSAQLLPSSMSHQFRCYVNCVNLPTCKIRINFFFCQFFIFERTTSTILWEPRTKKMESCSSVQDFEHQLVEHNWTLWKFEKHNLFSVRWNRTFFITRGTYSPGSSVVENGSARVLVFNKNYFTSL